MRKCKERTEKKTSHSRKIIYSDTLNWTTPTRMMTTNRQLACFSQTKQCAEVKSAKEQQQACFFFCVGPLLSLKVVVSSRVEKQTKTKYPRAVRKNETGKTATHTHTHTHGVTTTTKIFSQKDEKNSPRFLHPRVENFLSEREKHLTQTWEKEGDMHV